MPICYSLSLVAGHIAIAKVKKEIASGIGTAVLGTLLKGLTGWHGIFFLSAGIVGVGFIASFFFNDQHEKKQ